MENKNSEENLFNILKDFLRDLINTFPELLDTLDNNLLIIYNKTLNTSTNDEDGDKDKDKDEDKDEVNDEDEGLDDETKTAVDNVKQYIMQIIPERFFDILYEDNGMFEKDVNLILLPNINFKELWKEDISDNTRKTIWKYLQLILFSTISEISNKNSFGETSEMFNNIGEEELNEKLHDTINNIKCMFNNTDVFNDDSIDVDKMPNADDIHNHINSMMDGKLGKLAKEIAEETANELNLNTENVNSINDVFEKMLKNPSNLMNMVKNVGEKLDSKIKSGDIKESELLSEANDIMKNMNNIPGMGNMKDMLSKFGINPSDLDNCSMNNKFNQNMKKAKKREKMKSKINNLEKNITVTQEELKQQQVMLEQQMKEADDALKELLNDLGDPKSSNFKTKINKCKNKKKKNCNSSC